MKVQEQRFQLDSTLAGGSQPDRKGLERLARKGFRSILNLSAEGEEGPQLSPNVEASWAHTFGLRHGRLSIYPDNLRPELVERFQRALAALPPPVYVGSRNGRRAAAFLTLHLGLERGLDAEQAFEAARALGMDCESVELRAFVRTELERNANGSLAPVAGARAHTNLPV